MKTTEQLVLEQIRESIAELSPDAQGEIREMARLLRNYLVSGGAHASYAFALVGAELAAEED